MNKLHKLLTVTALATTLALAGCWGDDDDDPVAAPPTPPPASTEVPDSAGVSTAAFFAYILSLSGSNESSEPLTLKDSFAVPAEESAEPTSLP